jgi:hypothetical protein
VALVLLGAFAAVKPGSRRPTAAQGAAPAPVPAWNRGADLISAPPPLWRAFDWPAGHAAGGVGVDPSSGRVFGTDLDADAVRAYGPDGLFEGAVGVPGDRPLQFRSPRDVAVLADGRLAVSDTGNDRVQVVSPTGEQVVAWKVGGPRGIVVVGERLYVLSGRDRAILAFDLAGTPRGILLLPEIAADAETLFWLGDVPGSTPPRARFRLPLPGDGRVLEIEEGSGRLLWAPGVPGARALLRWRDWTVAGTYQGLRLLRDAGSGSAFLPLGAIGDLAADGAGGAWIASEHGLLQISDLDRVLGDAPAEAGWLHAPRRVAAGTSGLALADDPAWPQLAWRGHLRPTAGAQPSGVGLDLRAPAAAGDFVDVAASGDDTFVLTTQRDILRWRDGDWRAVAPRLQGSAWPVAIAGVPAPAGSELAPADALVAVLDPGLAAILWLDADLRELRRDALPLEVPATGLRDLAVGADRLWLLDGLRRRLLALDAEGRLELGEPLIEAPRAVAVLPDGRGVALLASGWLHVLAREGGAVPAAALRAAPLPAAAARDASVQGPAFAADWRGPATASDLTIDDSGTVYVADPCDALLPERDPAGGAGEPAQERVGHCVADGQAGVRAVGDAPEVEGRATPRARPPGEPAGRIRVLPPATGGLAAAPATSGSGCVLRRYAEARPSLVRVGERVTVTLGLAGSCPPAAAGVEPPAVALVIEHGAAASAYWDALRDAALDLVVELQGAGATVAVIAFAERAERLLAPGGEVGSLAELLAEREAAGPADLAAALATARGTLTRAATGPRTMILIATGTHDGDEQALADAIVALEADGVSRTVLALAPPAYTWPAPVPDPDAVARLERIDDGGGDGGSALRKASGAPELRHHTRALARPLARAALLARAEVAVSPHAALSAHGSASLLRWRPGEVSTEGLQLSFALEAGAAGFWPAYAEAVLTATLTGETGPAALDFPVPWIEVLPPASATPSPAETQSPSPTAVTVTPAPGTPGTPPTSFPTLTPGTPPAPSATPTASAIPSPGSSPSPGAGPSPTPVRTANSPSPPSPTAPGSTPPRATPTPATATRPPHVRNVILLPLVLRES